MPSDKKLCNGRAGQGLMETIVALGVIMTGLISVVALTVSNLNGEREAATRYQAMNLAREAVELVRNKRDSNWLAGVDAWAGVISGGAVLQFSPELGTANLVTVNLTNTPIINQCGGGGVFAQGDQTCTQTTRFSRTLTITPRTCSELGLGATCTGVTDPIARVVFVQVAWNQSGLDRQVTLEEIMYDWK